MTTGHNVTTQSNQPVISLTPILIGGGIALALISLFLFTANYSDPAWGTYWMIRPLIITPLAGALGGAIYSFLDYQSSRGFNRTVAILLSLVIYVIGLWMGFVLGLAGTFWN